MLEATTEKVALRHIGKVNIVGMLALARSQVPVFWHMKEWWLADIVTVPLYILVAIVALGDNSYIVSGLDYISYLGYGLLLFTCFIRSFESAAYLMMDNKINGSFPSFVQSPMLAWELLLIWNLTCLVYGLILGGILSIVLFGFGLPLPQFSWQAVILLTLFCFIAASVGHFACLLSQKWDHIVGVDSFIVMPILILSGVFFSPEALPEILARIYDYNPFFLIIDNLRMSFAFGEAIKISNLIMAFVMAAGTFILSIICLEKGWGVKL